MRTVATAMQWVVRLTGLAQIVLGIVLWVRPAGSLRGAHIGIGFVLALAVLVLAALAARARAPLGFVALGALLALTLPVHGLGQLRWLPGDSHWIVRVLHLVLGLATLGVADGLGRRVLGAGLGARGSGLGGASGSGG
ncbi:MAG TPA: hypothetical protein VKA84_20815 [Gemmatimonadaceae bacterium]|nr:hypothetical protein [Gemmatimonadaceae bacterium]